MTNIMRDKISDILLQTCMSSEKSEIVANAIIAALPDMVPPLEWNNNTRHGRRVHTSGYYSVIEYYPDGHVAYCIQYRGVPMRDKKEFRFLGEAKAAANKHHAEQLMKGLGL